MSIIAATLLALALPAPGVVVQDKDPNKIVCKSDQNTGSRLQRRRVCHTRAEWGEINAERNRKADAEGSTFRNEEIRQPDQRLQPIPP